MEKKIDKRKEVEITLDFPVQLADRKLEKVTMRRPRMSDMIKHNIGADAGLQESVNLLSTLCDLVPDEMEQMDTVDFDKLQKQLLAFRGVAEPE